MKLSYQKKTGSTPPKIGVAMSGGVDSSVTAALLKKHGYKVQGFFLALNQHDLDLHIARVQKIAAQLKVPLEIINLAEDFEKEVLTYFTTSYLKGKTPNPCIICNYKIKFGRLLDIITSKGFAFLATGHYARIVHEPGAVSQLLMGKDPKKDQSYFLSQLTQAQIARTHLPLGEYTKENVYRIAAEIGLQGMYARESQDVCFLHDQDIGQFLLRKLGSKLIRGGNIVTLDGKRIGRHHGIHTFTIGQRRGLGIPDPTPYYVVGLDPGRNEVVVGKRDDLFQDHLKVRKVNWLSGTRPDLPQQYDVKIRYRHQATAAVVETEKESDSGPFLIIRFQEPQQAVTPGQYAVFYRGREVIGSGEICV